MISFFLIICEFSPTVKIIKKRYSFIPAESQGSFAHDMKYMRKLNAMKNILQIRKYLCREMLSVSWSLTNWPDQTFNIISFPKVFLSALININRFLAIILYFLCIPVFLGIIKKDFPLRINKER